MVCNAALQYPIFFQRCVRELLLNLLLEFANRLGCEHAARPRTTRADLKVQIQIRGAGVFAFSVCEAVCAYGVYAL